MGVVKSSVFCRCVIIIIIFLFFLIHNILRLKIVTYFLSSPSIYLSLSLSPSLSISLSPSLSLSPPSLFVSSFWSSFITSEIFCLLFLMLLLCLNKNNTEALPTKNLEGIYVRYSERERVRVCVYVCKKATFFVALKMFPLLLTQESFLPFTDLDIFCCATKKSTKKRS